MIKNILKSSSVVRGSKVYSWGGSALIVNHEEGILGRIEDKNTYSTPTPLKEFSTSPVISISSALNHTICCTQSGEVFTWGNNKSKVLGNCKEESDTVATPKLVPGLKNVVEVAAGDRVSAALTLDGKLFTWGFPGSFVSGSGALGRKESPTSTEMVPDRVYVGGSEEDIRIKQIAAGHQHMMALGLDGEVWLWGKGSSGLMGDGKSLDRTLPVPLTYLLDTNVQVKQVACGSNFNMVLDTDGAVYSWGVNSNGQLGLGGGFSMDIESVPRQVEVLWKEKIIHIAAGFQHAAAVTDKGEVYMWGYATWTEPHKMTTLEGKKIIKAACGLDFTCVLTDSGEVYSWGRNLIVSRTGVLGMPIGEIQQIGQPQLVKSIPESISFIACGQRAVFCLNGLPQI